MRVIWLSCSCIYVLCVCERRVKLAVHETSGEECAIKVMDKSKIHASAMTLHVRREIAIMKTLRHPYVIRLHAVLNSSSKLYLVMDLVRGGELFHKIVREGALSEAEGRRHFQQLVDGVSYCHSMDVCHRDLKVRSGWSSRARLHLLDISSSLSVAPILTCCLCSSATVS